MTDLTNKEALWCVGLGGEEWGHSKGRQGSAGWRTDPAALLSAMKPKIQACVSPTESRTRREIENVVRGGFVF